MKNPSRCVCVRGLRVLFGAVWVLVLGLGAEVWANEPVLDVPVQVLALDGAPVDMDLGDLDDDGDEDIVLCLGDRLQWLENTRDGAFVLRDFVILDDVAPPSSCSKVRVARFGRPALSDGTVDVVYLGPADEGLLSSKPAQGGYELTRRFNDHIGRTLLEVGDLGNEGTEDLLVGFDSSGVRTYLSNGGPLSIAQHFIGFGGRSMTEVFSVHVGDFTHDGESDVLIKADDTVLGVSYFLATGSLSSWDIEQVFEAGGRGLDRVGDTDNDGTLDVVYVDASGRLVEGQLLRTLDGEGLELDGLETLTEANAGITVLELADLDEDGNLDVVHSASGEVLRIQRRNPQTGTWSSRDLGPAADTGTNGLKLLDADGDGDLDLVTATDSGVYLHRNITLETSYRSSSRQQRLLLPGLEASRLLVQADFDRDGDVDLISGRFLYLQEDDGTWSSQQISSNQTLRDGQAVDFDDDGDVDLVAISSQGVVWLRHDPDRLWRETLIVRSDDPVFKVHNIDRDSKLDVVIGDRATGQLEWFRGGLVLRNNPIDSTFASIGDVDVADIDGDGDEDIVVIRTDDNDNTEVAWYSNRSANNPELTGVGRAWEDFVVGPFVGSQTQRLRLLDCDRDGVLELLVVGDAAVIFDPVDPDGESRSWASDTITRDDGNLADMPVAGPVDVDKDGLDDVFLYHFGDTRRYKGRIEGSSPPMRSDFWTDDTEIPAAQVVADIDGDGDLDLIASFVDEGVVAYWNTEAQTAGYFLETEDNDLGRVYPGTFATPFLIETGLGDDAEVGLVVESFELRAAFGGGAAISAQALASYFEVRLYRNDDGERGFDAESDGFAATTAEVTQEDTVRYRLVPEDADALAIVADDFFEFYVAIDPLPAFYDLPIQDVLLEFVADSLAFRVQGFGAAISNVTSFDTSRPSRVVAGNNAPAAGAVAAVVAAGESVTMRPLDTASDVDGDPLSVVEILTEPLLGTVFVEGNTFVYEANSDQEGEDTFIYALTDRIDTVLGVATVSVSGDFEPFARPMSVETVEDTPLELNLLGGDPEGAPNFVIVSEPEHGTVALIDAARGLALYVPDPNYVGPDAFGFAVEGVLGTSDPVEVSLVVLACDLDDDDGDGVIDGADNCPLVSNSQQEDLDFDGLGNVCDDDDDNDGVVDGQDNCPLTPNAAQANTDGDDDGDVCDGDDDDDGVLDGADNCPLLANVDQGDLDQDLRGDACDDDDDGDAIVDAEDNCLRLSNRAQWDTDEDGQGDDCDEDDDNDGVPDGDDVCPFLADDQSDLDEDGLGDACDADADSDGVLTEDDCDDTVPFVGLPITYFADGDGDGVGDSDDTVAVCDGTPPDGFVEAGGDNCPDDANDDQADLDEDGAGDVCDDDIDGDEVPNGDDECPREAADTPDGCPEGAEDMPDAGMEDVGDEDVEPQDAADDAGVEDAVDGDVPNDDASGDADADGVPDGDDAGDEAPNVNVDSGNDGGCGGCATPNAPPTGDGMLLVFGLLGLVLWRRRL